MTRLGASLVLAALLGGCGSCEGAAPVVELRPEPGAAASGEPHAPARASATPPREPWGVRFARPCSWGEWFAAGDRLIACRSVFDAESGRYLGRQPDQTPLLALPRGSLWSSGYWGDDDEAAELVVRGDDLSVRSRIPLRRPVGKAVTLDDGTIVAIGDRFVVEVVDLANGTVEEQALECASPHSELFRSPSGELDCVREGERAAAEVREGATVLDSSQARRIVLDEDTRELWLDGATAERERIFTMPVRAWMDSSRARFVGSDVVVHHGETMLWLRRGARGSLPDGDETLSFAASLSECSTLRREDGESPLFTGDGTFNRELVDSRAFECGGVLVRASFSDADELAGLEDDARWATALMDRYGDQGSERWAYFWRREDGSRRLEGHYYIGGCERTHVMLSVVESGGRLEIYTAYGAEAPMLEPIPESARRAEVDEGAYVGDPSIGFRRM